MAKVGCLHKRNTNGMSGDAEKTGNFCSFALPSPPWVRCLFLEDEDACSFWEKAADTSD